MSFEGIGMGHIGRVGAMLGAQDAPKWRCEYLVEKYWKAADAEHDAGDREVIQGVGNLLLNGGADIVWERLITKNPSTSATGAVSQAFSTISKIGVSTSNTAAAASQTGLQGSTKWFSTMESGYPAHTTGTSTAARTCSFRSVFTTSEANIAWNEWIIVNSTGQRALNRKVQSLGTKTSAAQWTFTATLTLS